MLVFLQYIFMYQISNIFFFNYEVEIWKEFEFLSDFFIVYFPLQCTHFFCHARRFPDR